MRIVFQHERDTQQETSSTVCGNSTAIWKECGAEHRYAAQLLDSGPVLYLTHRYFSAQRSPHSDVCSVTADIIMMVTYSGGSAFPCLDAK
jgi:hypothetical protein